MFHFKVNADNIIDYMRHRVISGSSSHNYTDFNSICRILLQFAAFLLFVFSTLSVSFST